MTMTPPLHELIRVWDVFDRRSSAAPSSPLFPSSSVNLSKQRRRRGKARPLGLASDCLFSLFPLDKSSSVMKNSDTFTVCGNDLKRRRVTEQTPTARSRSYRNALKDLKFHMEEGGEEAAFRYLEGKRCKVPLCHALVKLFCAVAGENKTISIKVATKKQAAILVGHLVAGFNDLLKIEGPNTLILPNDEFVNWWAKLIRESSFHYLSGDGLDDGNRNPILSENKHSKFSKSIFKFGGLAIWKKATLSALVVKKVEDKYMLTRQHYFGFMLSSILLDVQPVSADFLKKIKQMIIIYVGDDQAMPEDIIVFNDDFFGSEELPPPQDISMEAIEEDVGDETKCGGSEKIPSELPPPQDISMEAIEEDVGDEDETKCGGSEKIPSELPPPQDISMEAIEEDVRDEDETKCGGSEKIPSELPPPQDISMEAIEEDVRDEDETKCGGSEKIPSKAWEVVSVKEKAGKTASNIRSPENEKFDNRMIVSSIITVASFVWVVYYLSDESWGSVSVISFNLLIVMAIYFGFK
ncbi:hypothetical protein IV203_007579 [Nitzschia inconspicua]|uniref:Uncharacterized protein n=1 Tax=Nitzschia inconspicua TaxID=303405 RepID=A0A9K3KFS7_9STRA|nr:hypothetical protein IV203_007579 [Nitzschia inconspicua]